MVAFHDFGQRGEPGLGPHLRVLGIVPAEGRPRPAKTVVFIRCDEQVNLDHLGQHDIEVNQPRGAVRTAYLPLASLDQLSEDPAVQRILPTHYLRPLMDVARTRVHVPEFRNASGLSGSSGSIMNAAKAIIGTCTVWNRLTGLSMSKP